MISPRTTTDTRALNDLTTFIEAVPEFIAEDMLEVAAENEQPLLSELGREGRPRGDDTYQWSRDPAANAKARGWWFANLRKGNIPTDGQHYIRQGQPPRGWEVTVEYDGDTPVIVIRNTWSKARYVFGSLRGTGAAGTRSFMTQNPTHLSDGWPFAKPIVDERTRIIINALIGRYDDRIKALGKRSKFRRR